MFSMKNINSPSKSVDIRNISIKENPKVVVVGAGMGGLVSALILSHAGADVTVLESHADCGGKMRVWIQMRSTGNVY